MGKRKKQRREATAEPEEPLPPVLTLTCPNCGGAVNDAELGERTSCTFCGTDLHLPRIDNTPDEPPAPPSEKEPESDGVPPGFEPVAATPHPPNVGVALAAGGVITVGLLAMWIATRPSPGSSDLPSYPNPVELPDPKMDALTCYGDCIGACTELPPNPNIFSDSPTMKCIDACEKKCNYPPKIPVAECRKKCDEKCDGAPDEATRIACLGSCKAACR